MRKNAYFCLQRDLLGDSYIMHAHFSIFSAALSSGFPYEKGAVCVAPLGIVTVCNAAHKIMDYLGGLWRGTQGIYKKVKATTNCSAWPV